VSNNNKVVRAWLKRAEYDLETAKAMLEARRYLYVGVMAQQAVEKLFKAVYFKKFRKEAPRTHNLVYLAELVDISELDLNFLGKLTYLYSESRYSLTISITKNEAKEVYKKCWEVFSWLKKELLK
jgi:HEPN domain-containing protein